MSFLRPAALTALSRWGEAMITGALAALALSFLGRAIIASAALWWIAILACLALVFCVLAYQAILRARIKTDGVAEGVVILDEHRIGYFGPQTGGFVEIKDLVRLDLFDGHWVLHQSEGPFVRIPHDAPNAAALTDLFSQLPGVSLQKVHDSLRKPRGLKQTLWQAHLR